MLDFIQWKAGKRSAPFHRGAASFDKYRSRQHPPRSSARLIASITTLWMQSQRRLAPSLTSNLILKDEAASGPAEQAA
jgi:hypothetical protein